MQQCEYRPVIPFQAFPPNEQCDRVARFYVTDGVMGTKAVCPQHIAKFIGVRASVVVRIEELDDIPIEPEWGLLNATRHLVDLMQDGKLPKE